MIKIIMEKEVNHDLLPKPTKQTNFEGFDISKVSDRDNSYKKYQEFMNNPELAKKEGFENVYIASMSPQEYMDLCTLYVSRSENDLEKLTDINGKYKHFAETCYEYAEEMKSGKKFPLLILDLYWKEQDGRHRAAAAYINGIKSVPVLLCY